MSSHLAVRRTLRALQVKTKRSILFSRSSDLSLTWQHRWLTKHSMLYKSPQSFYLFSLIFFSVNIVHFAKNGQMCWTPFWSCHLEDVNISKCTVNGDLCTCNYVSPPFWNVIQSKVFKLENRCNDQKTTLLQLRLWGVICQKHFSTRTMNLLWNLKCQRHTMCLETQEDGPTWLNDSNVWFMQPKHSPRIK